MQAFIEDTARVSAWFDRFSFDGIRHFGPGSKAFAQYALAHRTECWPLLCWRRRALAPVTVATRTRDFSELSVPGTIHGLWQARSPFWRSEELSQSCRSSAWVETDPSFFVEVRRCHNTCATGQSRLHAAFHACNCRRHGSSVVQAWVRVRVSDVQTVSKLLQCRYCKVT
jgi:hypothetical protein